MPNPLTILSGTLSIPSILFLLLIGGGIGFLAFKFAQKLAGMTFPSPHLLLTMLFTPLLFYACQRMSLPPVERGLPPETILRFAIFLYLFFVMTVVSLIDLETFQIPDALMIPATVFGVILMTLFPTAALPVLDFTKLPEIVFRPLVAFDGWSDPRFGFGVTIASILFWVFALLDRRWFFPRLKFGVATRLFFRRLRQSRLTLLLPLIGLTGIVATWVLYRLPETPERVAMKSALLSAVFGMVAGMTIVWGVRLIGGWVLRREAMGFGDVVLIGFLGVFTGWQGVTILFFLAPFAGLVFGILRILFRANREIPYGPFLCLATLFLLFFWREIEEITRPLRNGPTVAIVLAVMAVLMAILLLVLQGIKAIFSHFFR